MAYQPSLPDLATYRAELLREGATVPVSLVPSRATGLLGELPLPSGQNGWPWTTQTAPFASTDQSWPRITIVMPSFQQGAYLEEAIRSVLLQNYPNLEFIVIDGGSRDDSPALLERYRPWLSFVRSASDRGQAHAINLGFSLGAGDLCGWLNSDDFYLPGALRRVAETWRGGAEFIYGNGLALDQPSGCLRHEVANRASARYVKFAGLVPSHASFWSAAKHRPLWEEQQCAVDYELWVRLLPGMTMRHINFPLAVVRLHDASKSGNPAMAKRWLEDAARNGQAHPELYRQRPWLDREFRVVQLMTRQWRLRTESTTLAALAADCGWNKPILVSGRGA